MKSYEKLWNVAEQCGVKGAHAGRRAGSESPRARSGAARRMLPCWGAGGGGKAQRQKAHIFASLASNAQHNAVTVIHAYSAFEHAITRTTHTTQRHTTTQPLIRQMTRPIQNVRGVVDAISPCIVSLCARGPQTGQGKVLRQRASPDEAEHALPSRAHRRKSAAARAGGAATTAPRVATRAVGEQYTRCSLTVVRRCYQGREELERALARRVRGTGCPLDGSPAPHPSRRA
jgi:hypothetical protein